MNKKIMLLFATLAVLIGIGSFVYMGWDEGQASSLEKNQNNTDNQTKDYIPVEVKGVSVKDFAQHNDFIGEVAPSQSVEVKAQTSAVIILKEGRVGQAVSLNDVLYALSKKDINDQIRASKVELDIAQTSYILQLEEYKTNEKALIKGEKLYGQGAISQKELDNLKQNASSKILDAHKAQLQRAKDSYKTMLKSSEKSSIKSPMAGVIASLNFDLNDRVETGETVAEIINMDTIHIQISVTEGLVNKLKAGDFVEVFIDALNRQEAFVGQVVEVSPVTNETKLYEVKVSLENIDHEIKPGMFAEVRIPVKESKGALSVPSEAVVRKGDRDLVYLVEENEVIEREVTTGMMTKGYSEITSGLTSKDQVIVKGQNFVKAGSVVKIVGEVE